MLEILTGCLIAVGLILPGWGWARAAGGGMVESMVVSWLVIFAGVLTGDLCGVPLQLGWLMLVLGGATGAGFWLAIRKGCPLAPRIELPKLGWGWGVLPLVLVAIWKASVQPLSGVDVDFRWNYLAELMVEIGSLEFYPPTSDSDFATYFWADGIPPLVSSLYLWTYLVAGETDRTWTVVPVLMQWLAVLGVLWKLGSCWGGEKGATGAWLFAAATFLLQFAINLGQETALTAIGVGVMIFNLLPRGDSPEPRSLTLAALGAALIPCSREYGWALAMAGMAGWAITYRAWRLSPTTWLAWSWLALPAWWYVRTWVHSGNPWLSLSMGGVFEVNPVFAEWMKLYREIYGEGLGSGRWLADTAVLLLRTATPAVLGLGLGFFVFRRKPGWLIATLVVAATLLCWVLSIPYTGGGPFYAMRVLSPALLIGCAWGGAVWATLPPRWDKARLVAGGLLVLVAIDASLRALTIPANPWRVPSESWLEVGYAWQREFAAEQSDFLDQVAELTGGKVLSDSAGLQGPLRSRGVELIPLWSPAVRELFDDRQDSSAVDLLRARGFTHVLLKKSDISADFLINTGALPRLQPRLQGVMASDTYALFALRDSDQ